MRQKRTTDKDLANKYNISTKTVQRYRKNGTLETYILEKETAKNKAEITKTVVKTVMADSDLKVEIKREALKLILNVLEDLNKTPIDGNEIEPKDLAFLKIKMVEAMAKLT